MRSPNSAVCLRLSDRIMSHLCVRRSQNSADCKRAHALDAQHAPVCAIWIHVCTRHAYTHTHARTHARMHARTRTHARTHTHTCIHAYMHTCIHAYMHTCMHTIHRHMTTHCERPRPACAHARTSPDVPQSTHMHALIDTHRETIDTHRETRKRVTDMKAHRRVPRGGSPFAGRVHQGDEGR